MTELYTVERDIPMPERTGKGRGMGPFTSTAKALEVGESFQTTTEDWKKNYASLCRLKPKKFVTRKVPEEGADKRRIWRIA